MGVLLAGVVVLVPGECIHGTMVGSRTKPLVPSLGRPVPAMDAPRYTRGIGAAGPWCKSGHQARTVLDQGVRIPCPGERRKPPFGEVSGTLNPEFPVKSAKYSPLDLPI